MLDLELYITAARNLRQQGMRSYLTLLGIIIGIAAVVALLSIGQGLNMAVAEQFEKLGTTTITVLPGSSVTESLLAKLREDDAETISSVKGVEYATPLYINSATIEFQGERKSLIAIGIDPAMQEKFGEIGMLDLDSGRVMMNNEKYGILIGNRLAKDIYKNEISVKQRINSGSYILRVVGIIRPQSRSLGSFFDSAVVMNYETLKEISPTALTPFRIIVKAQKQDDVEGVKQRISAALEKKHKKKDFMIFGQEQIMERATSVLGVIQIVLVGIAAISLFVGGLGIMNTMFMAITERTKEIGVMKAIGATNNEILSLFLAESSLIGLIGGLLGVILGFALAFAVSIVASLADLPLEAYVGLELIVGSLLFSLIVGIVSGLIPSFRAAKMEPVDALRDMD